jgi:predicted helicase
LNLTQYLAAIQKELAQGNSTEHTHRPSLKRLLESLGDNLTATNEPQRIRCGAPDFIVTRGQIPLGYVEAKDIGVSLDLAERSDQLERYRESLSNLILTDYLEFRWYVWPKNSRADEYPIAEHRLTARLATVGRTGRLRVQPSGERHVGELLSAFLSSEVPTVEGARELAVRMAALARLIRDTIQNALSEEGETGSLHQQMVGFRDVLIHDLSEAQFADMYAQTICYGLFAARCNTSGSEHFTREHAAYDLPKTNPFLRKMFAHIAGPELDERIAWAVDDLAELLHRSNINAIIEDFGKRARREDPVVHFYETFLASYDPGMREARGVYYTPEPVVSFIVRSIDHILKTDFKLSAGLADSSKVRIKNPGGRGTLEVHKVLILDPATGTGTFLYGVINQVFETFTKNLGMWSGYVSEHLLPRLFGFELLMAPYAVAHMKLGLQLDATGYDFKANERLRVYLTNTLEEAHEVSKMPLFTQWLAEEANEASRVKQDLPIMVVLGNPPYSRASYNKGTWIEDLMRDYKVSVREEESQIQGLSNDYIKFIRFAQWRIDRTNTGILGLITGHGYINGPQARDMRQSLLASFDRIYILNLHGSIRRTVRRDAEDERDEPVFNIQQGTAIILAVKRGLKRKRVFYAELLGSLSRKFAYLGSEDVSTTPWTELDPQAPGYYFVPYSDHSLSIQEEYETFWSLPQVFGTGNPKSDKEMRWATGFASQQDEFAISFTDSELEAKIKQLLESASEEDLRIHYRLCTTNQWSYSRAKEELRKGSWDSEVGDCAYRPFDTRRTVYDRNVVSILRRNVMSQLRNIDNVALISSRVVNDAEFAHIFVADMPVDKIFLSNKTSTNAYVFPLYFYGDNSGQLPLRDSTDDIQDRFINLSPSFVSASSELLKMTFIADEHGDLTNTFGPRDLFDYIYAVFYSPTYRVRYAELLKADFPRVPLTQNTELFRQLCACGSELIGLHLMKQHTPKITRYPVAGGNKIESVHYSAGTTATPEEGRVWINREQYFEGVLREVWDFHVGGYKPCEKWLKDRRGRQLTYDNLTQYQQIVSVVTETLRLMVQIDCVIDEFGGWPVS